MQVILRIGTCPVRAVGQRFEMGSAEQKVAIFD